MEKKKNSGFMIILSLFAVAFATSTNTSMTVLLNSISQKFPDIPITTIYLLTTAQSFIQLGVKPYIGTVDWKKSVIQVSIHCWIDLIYDIWFGAFVLY